MRITLPPDLAEPTERVTELVTQAGGRALLVGGFVRDALLGRTSKDIDIEVYGIAPDDLVSLLSPHFRLDEVGRSFGVLKLYKYGIDVSLPRREAKTGPGHRGFAIDADPSLAPEEALARRDFTINALAYDPVTDQVLDPFGGQADLQRRVLRHTSDRFGEDPLRVLRGMQFVARFALTATPETVEICRQMDTEDLARERIFAEWAKLILLGEVPSTGLRFLRDVDWLRHFPELAALVDCPQDPQWHPEGDVWVHTLHCMDHFARHRIGDEREDLIVGLAVLCHDLGKPDTTVFERGRTRSPGHSARGEELTRTFLGRMTDERDLIESVTPLVRAHLRPYDLFREQSSDRAIRRLARDVGRIDRLVRVAQSDHGGRPPLPADDDPAGEWLLARARDLELEDSRPRPIMKGRHLIGLGRSPGPEFKRTLDQCFEAQLDGVFSGEEDGLAFLKDLLSKESTD